MPQNDILKRYIDAGLAFTALTQSRAEELVQDLVRVGEVRADQARDVVVELLERSRKNSERLLETVRAEVRLQITSLGLATQADLDRIEERIASVIDTATAPAKQAVLKAVPPRKAPARPAGSAEAPDPAPATGPGKKPAKKAKKAPAKAAAKKKAPAKKAPAKKAAVKKAPAKKAPAKKTPASNARPSASPAVEPGSTTPEA